MLSPGTRLGPYAIVSPIGAGGMGEVYRAHDSRLSRDIALKILPQLSNPDVRRRFESEARAASAVTHPNIVVIHDIGEEGGVAYIAMELVEGRTLRNVASSGPLELDRLLRIAIQIAEALRAAHSHGIAHRDLKPENVLLTPNDLVKVVDFGIAKRSLSVNDQTINGTEAGIILGTPGYMAPEQARGLASDARSDQFALGAVLYELASGRRAFQKASPIETAAATIAEEPIPLPTLRPDLPTDLSSAIERCLAKDPANRYECTDDLCRELVAIRDHLREHDGHYDYVPQVGGLIGRRAEASRLIAMLQSPAVQWVTMTGAGGVGKTTLAQFVAASAGGLFPGSVFSIPLASISDPVLVVPAIGAAVGALPNANESPGDALARWLRDKPQPLLLVLDNFEHVANAAPDVSRLVSSVRGVKVLATSRALLHLSHEHEFVVEGLDADSAIQLFTVRAKSARPQFQPTASERADIAMLCAYLGRLPLAIELSAARIKLIPPKTLLNRLQGRLLSLSGGPRDLPERQQTLRATVDWSFGLLTSPEQRLFRRLGVFAGGWTLDAAESVCNAREDLGIEVLDGIASLLDKSLISRVAPAQNDDRDPRFTMLEVLREYAIERLDEAGETAWYRRAHAAYCLVLCEEGGAATDVVSQTQWLVQCDADLPNIRVACAYLIDSGATEWALRIANSLFQFWQARGLLVEGESLLRNVLAMAGAAHHPTLRAQCLFDLSSITHTRGDYPTSLAMAREATREFQLIGDIRGMAATHNGAGIAHRDSGNYPEARHAFGEAIRLWQAHGDHDAAARALSNLASVEVRAGEYDEARRLYGECRQAFSTLSDEAGIMWTLQHEGDAAREAGELQVAETLNEQAYSRFKRASDDWGLSSCQTALGDLRLDVGDTKKASALFTEALAITLRLGSARGIARLLDAFARTAAVEGRNARALRLAAAASTMRQQLGVHLPDNERRALDRALSSARTLKEANAIWMEGCAMSADQAIAYATSVTT